MQHDRISMQTCKIRRITVLLQLLCISNAVRDGHARSTLKNRCVVVCTKLNSVARLATSCLRFHSNFWILRGALDLQHDRCASCFEGCAVVFAAHKARLSHNTLLPAACR